MTFTVLPVCKALSTSAYFGEGSSALTIVLTMTANSKDKKIGGVCHCTAYSLLPPRSRREDGSMRCKHVP